MEGIETLQRWMDESSRIVFFGGAGVSTESGIPDFRSVDPEFTSLCPITGQPDFCGNPYLLPA